MYVIVSNWLLTQSLYLTILILSIYILYYYIYNNIYIANLLLNQYCLTLIYKSYLMIFKTMIQVFQGNLHLVQYVKYSNGKVVKRVLDKQGLPIAIFS